jgi:drug/metabolite transporter (DMT)-like permease
VLFRSESQGRNDALPFAVGLYLVCGLVNLITGGFFERPAYSNLVFVLPAAIAFTLQVIAQKHTPATDASLILSLEAVFTAFFGRLILHRLLFPVQILGCGIILSAVILV